MTKALAPHTPSIPASLIRPQQAEAEGFVGAKKQKARPPLQGCPAWSGGRGVARSRASFSATILAVPVRSHHDSTFRRLGRNQAPRFVVVRLTKRVRRNHAFRETPLLCSFCSFTETEISSYKKRLHLSVKQRLLGAKSAHQKFLFWKKSWPDTGPEPGGSTCSHQ